MMSNTFHREKPRHLHFPEQITACTNAFNAIPVNSYVYLYDTLGRPTNRNAHAFAYDWRGQLTCASLDSVTDTYVFNKSNHRGILAEKITPYGREEITGKPYVIHITGKKNISKKGNCCK